jgi:hypothetical protein
VLVPCSQRYGKPRYTLLPYFDSSHAHERIFSGILPHDGKNIPFTELNTKIRATYNFAPTFCFFVPDFAARMLNKDYKTGTFDLSELDLHSEKSIEHDASLLRTHLSSL